MARTGVNEIFLTISQNEKQQLQYESEALKKVFSNKCSLKIEIIPQKVELLDIMFFLVVNTERQINPREHMFLQPHYCWNDPTNHFFSSMPLSIKSKATQTKDRNPIYFSKFLFRDLNLYQDISSKDPKVGQITIQKNTNFAAAGPNTSKDGSSNSNLNNQSSDATHYFQLNFDFYGKMPCYDFQSAGFFDFQLINSKQIF